jgi:hypothetical protein
MVRRTGGASEGRNRLGKISLVAIAIGLAILIGVAAFVITL